MTWLGLFVLLVLSDSTFHRVSNKMAKLWLALVAVFTVLFYSSYVNKVSISSKCAVGSCV